MAVRKLLLRLDNVCSMVKSCMAITSFLRPHDVSPITKICMAVSKLLRPENVCSMVKSCMVVDNLLRPHDVSHKYWCTNKNLTTCAFEPSVVEIRRKYIETTQGNSLRACSSRSFWYWQTCIATLSPVNIRAANTITDRNTEPAHLYHYLCFAGIFFQSGSL